MNDMFAHKSGALFHVAFLEGVYEGGVLRDDSRQVVIIQVLSYPEKLNFCIESLICIIQCAVSCTPYQLEMEFTVLYKDLGPCCRHSYSTGSLLQDD